MGKLCLGASRARRLRKGRLRKEARARVERHMSSSYTGKMQKRGGRVEAPFAIKPGGKIRTGTRCALHRTCSKRRPSVTG